MLPFKSRMTGSIKHTLSACRPNLLYISETNHKLSDFIAEHLCTVCQGLHDILVANHSIPKLTFVFGLLHCQSEATYNPMNCPIRSYTHPFLFSSLCTLPQSAPISPTLSCSSYPTSSIHSSLSQVLHFPLIPIHSLVPCHPHSSLLLHTSFFVT